jgi:hypothetical protein
MAWNNLKDGELGFGVPDAGSPVSGMEKGPSRAAGSGMLVGT